VPRFILLDHSLRDTGGHHYPYAVSVLQAAEAAGFAPALGTHRDFSAVAGLAPHWPLHALFPAVSYSRHTLDTQARQPARGLLHRLTGSLLTRWRQRQRRRHIERFAEACTEFFRRVPLTAGDVVFLPTASELDLHGLAAFVAATPTLPAVHWHAQLHFGIHREPEWRRLQAAGKAAATAMQVSLHDVLTQCRGIRLSLWCTTEPLADQYRALQVADFQVLPYPVHPLFSDLRRLRLQPQPARIACLGHARREKNRAILPSLLHSLWQEAFVPGRAQLVVQNARASLRSELDACIAQLAREHSLTADAAPVDCSAGTLDQQQYAELVCGSDIGLLLYDARRYHDRCSGVLLEMLVAGVPVVVPAHSWLSEQIAPANQDWLEECSSSLAAAGRLQPLVSQDGSRFEIPPGTTGILLTAGLADADVGSIKVELALCGPSDAALFTRSHWLEAPRGRQQCRRLMPIPADCRSLIVQGGINPRVDAVMGPLPPLGAIGLAIEDSSGAIDALREILNHIEHYKQRAAKYAPLATEHCSSTGIVERLIRRQQ
jgi:hypothetical protein